MIEDTLRDSARVLEDIGLASAVVGGLAVSARTEPRFTRDVDLAIAVDDDEEAEEVVRRLVQEGWHLDATLEHEILDRLAAVRLSRQGSLGSDLQLDLLFCSSGVEAEIVHAAEVIELLPSIHVRVATAPDLVVLKLLSVAEDRPQDAADLAALAEVLDAPDWQRAQELIERVEELGADRGRALTADLADLRRSAE